MSKPIATGSYTIIDYNDAPLLNGWITANGPINQIYVPDTDEFSPNYVTKSLKLTASLFASGTTTDLLDNPGFVVTDMQWKILNESGIISDIPAATTRDYIVKENLVNDYSRTYLFTCKYTQPTSRVSVPVQISINITKTINGSGIQDLKVYTPNGNLFKNGNAETLTIEAQLWLGSKIVTNVTESSFKWWEMDPTGNGGSHGVGAGWREIVTGIDQELYKVTFSSQTSTSIFEVSKDAVVSSEVYMCTCQDPDSSVIYKATQVISDTTDPITVVVESTGGDKFKNGIGSTILTARLFQSDSEIDTEGIKYTYNWYKYDKGGNLVNNEGLTYDGSTPYFVGKKLSVTGDDVDEKATFNCDIY